MVDSYKYLGVLLFPIIMVLPFPLLADSIALGTAMLSLLWIGFCQRSLKWPKIHSKGAWLLYFSLFIFFIDWITQVLRIGDFGFVWRENRISLFIVPVIIALTREQIPRVFKIAQLGLIVGVLSYIAYAYAFLAYFYSFNTHRPFQFNQYLIYDLYHYLPGAYHHTYLGLYFTMAIVAALHGFWRSANRMWLFTALFIFFNQIFMGGKMTFLLSFLFISISLYISYRTIGSGKFFILLLVSLTSLALFLIVKTDLFQTLEFGFRNRINSWNCTVSVFLDNWFTGVGNVDLKLLLDDCIGSDAVSSHNQYLEELAHYGIFGVWLPAFFLMLLNKASGHVIYFCFLLAITILALSENILSLQRGILFFAFFNSVYYFYYQNKHESNLPFNHRTSQV